MKPHGTTRGATRGRRRHQVYRFADVFAGLGGFHVGLARLGHRCVFAAEIDPELRDLYEKNFGLRPVGDIRAVDAGEIPSHDILCAGFPCQPFSRAGRRNGHACPNFGNLIDDVLRIVEVHEPRYVLLENVPQILQIHDGAFWTRLEGRLKSLGYLVQHRTYSPLEFGIPQKRRRLFVVASRQGCPAVKWPTPVSTCPSFMEFAAELAPSAVKDVSPDRLAVLDLWQEFVQNVGEFSSLPVLADEFGATYPFNRRVSTIREARQYKGKFGTDLSQCTRWSELEARLPRYARGDHGLVGDRVGQAISYSRTLYSRHREFLKGWSASIRCYPLSWRKFEWQGERESQDLWRHLIQFRASGIRVIRSSSAPSLVAMSTTQIPIVGPWRRHMTQAEAASLQALDTLDHLPSTHSAVYKALGNAVNAEIVRLVAASLGGARSPEEVEHASQRGARHGHVQTVGQSEL